MSYEKLKELLSKYGEKTGCYHWVERKESDGRTVRLMYERSINDRGELEQFSSIEELEKQIKNRVSG